MNQTKSPQSAGGKITAERLRTKAINLYYKNPNICKNCNNIINVNNEKVTNIKKKTFCSKKCSASYNNKIRKRNKKPFHKCHSCGKNTHEVNKSIRKFCKDCRDLKNQKTSKIFKCESTSAKIRSHARTIMKSHKSCFICNYDKHIEICHIKPVRLFDDYSTLSEINSENNLLPLCRNHHWEFDHGLLDKENHDKILKKASKSV